MEPDSAIRIGMHPKRTRTTRIGLRRRRRRGRRRRRRRRRGRTQRNVKSSSAH
jgi:hypothetical protein